MLAERATTLVHLDYSRLVVLVRVTRRSITRRLRDAELWNGNREAPLRTIFTDRDHIIRWAWRTHPSWRDEVDDAAALTPLSMLYACAARRRRLACFDVSLTVGKGDSRGWMHEGNHGQAERYISFGSSPYFATR